MTANAAHTSLKCPNCASTLSEDTWNREVGMACCAYCGSMIRLPDYIKNFRPRPRMHMPTGVTVETTEQGLILTRSWATVDTMFARFAMLGCAVAIVWIVVSVLSEALLTAPPAIVHGVGLVFAYAILAWLFNRTYIKVSNGVMVVTHGPIPWGTKRVISTCEVEQLYSCECVATTKYGPHVYYELWVATVDGKTTLLLRNANLDRNQVLHIEQQLEMALGIDDRAVQGEIIRL